jgi:hypothetical protein
VLTLPNSLPSLLADIFLMSRLPMFSARVKNLCSLFAREVVDGK